VRFAAFLVGAAALVYRGNLLVVVAAVLVTGGPAPGAAAGLAVLASRLRWGTADLDAIIGNQDVLGPAIAVGPLAGSLSAALGLASLVLVARWDDRDRHFTAAGAVLCGALAGRLFLESPSVALGMLDVLPIIAAVVMALLRSTRPALDRNATGAGLAAGGLAVALAATV
jgi:hypothetical protein